MSSIWRKGRRFAFDPEVGHWAKQVEGPVCMSLAYDLAMFGGFKMPGAGAVKKRKLSEGPARVFAL